MTLRRGPASSEGSNPSASADQRCASLGMTLVPEVCLGNLRDQGKHVLKARSVIPGLRFACPHVTRDP